MEIYFSSDLHLGHRSVIGFQNRPFENVERWIMKLFITLIRNS